MWQSKRATLQKILISKIKDEDDADFVFWQQKCNSPWICSEGQTVNVTFYVQVLDHLCKHIACMRLEMWRDLKFFFLHNNAHLHTAAIVQQFLAKKGMAQLSHPPYSADISPPPRLFHYPKIEIGAERWPLCFDRRHIEICNCEIKSASRFLTSHELWNTRRLSQQVYSSVRRLFQINITYLNFFHRFRSVGTKLTRHTLYVLLHYHVES